MTGREYTSYQKGVITRYYDNIDSITLTKLQEMLTELYLADDEKKRDRLWEKARKAMIRLKIKPAIIEHIMAKKDAAILAKNLQDWLKTSK